MSSGTRKHRRRWCRERGLEWRYAHGAWGYAERFKPVPLEVLMDSVYQRLCRPPYHVRYSSAWPWWVKVRSRLWWRGIVRRILPAFKGGVFLVLLAGAGPARAATVWYTLPDSVEVHALTVAGADTVLGHIKLTDLRGAYLWGACCCEALPCDTVPRLLAGKDETGREGRRDSVVFADLVNGGRRCAGQHLVLYVTTLRATGARSYPSNTATWNMRKWDGRAWVER